MKNMLLQTAESFVNSKHRYQHLFYCNNGIKKATFNKTPNGYMSLTIKEYNPINRMFGYVSSTSSFSGYDILDTIKQELNIQPVKPIVIFRATQKVKHLS